MHYKDSMKILRICPGPQHLNEFRKKENLDCLTFSDQIIKLREGGLILPGSWAKVMAEQGFEVFETIYNDTALNAKWAIENGFIDVIKKPNAYFEILKEQVKIFRPDIIFVYAGGFFYITKKLRNELRKIKKDLVFSGFWGDELPSNQNYKDEFGDVDIIFTSSSIYESHMSANGINAITLGNCFDEFAKYEQSHREKLYDLTFCGTSGYAYPDHIQRYEMLKELLKTTKLKIWGYEPSLPYGRVMQFKMIITKIFSWIPASILNIITKIRVLNKLNSFIINASISRVYKVGVKELVFGQSSKNSLYFLRKKPLKKLFRGRLQKPLLSGSKYLELLASSKIVLNIHRDELADIGNIRCFEVTGVGSCLLTNHREGMREFFDVDNDIVTFETIEECKEKIDYLLCNPLEMQRIAENGQRATLTKHTVEARYKEAAKHLKFFMSSATKKDKKVKTQVLIATYDLQKYPISYDFIFFLQAANIVRKKKEIPEMMVVIKWPTNIEQIQGVSEAVNLVVGADARRFRIAHICNQLTNLMNIKSVIDLRDGNELQLHNNQVEYVNFPEGELPHHTEFYRIINADPNLVFGVSASVDALKQVKKWLDSISFGRKVLCITLRQYHVDTIRNSQIDQWAIFLDQIDRDEYCVIILPDTDHIAEFKSSILGKYETFFPACFDIDLRFALYELSYLNMFVNNGPSVAATLNIKIKYLLFKILAPSIPHCTKEFIEWQGFTYGETPRYSNKYQKWVWAEDDSQILISEFNAMVKVINDDHKTL